ncbi:uncharacterized protein [Haliotis cracherodii]|uniref:uncharacterized protein n=1 Tax=Haliotis cracherodii TaxID=6455 RepID=UPI0039E77652
MMGLGSGCFVSVLFISVGAYDICGIGSYFDPVINRCDLCSDICDIVGLTDTNEDCQRYCPDYGKAKGCSDEQYYDPVVGRCDSCEELCYGDNIQDTTEECKDKCPNYNTGALGLGSGRSKVQMIAIAVPLSLVVVAVVIVGLLWRLHLLSSVLQRCLRYPGKGYTKPQQCSDGSDTSGSNFSSTSDVQPQVDNVIGVDIKEQEGFPDLHAQGRHSSMDVSIH